MDKHGARGTSAFSSEKYGKKTTCVGSWFEMMADALQGGLIWNKCKDLFVKNDA